MTEEKCKEEEQDIIKGAPKLCEYPEWTFRTVQENTAKKEENIKKGKDDNKEKSRGMVVLPYVKGHETAHRPEETPCKI